jgi:bile acid-coenzyme A ligase
MAVMPIGKIIGWLAERDPGRPAVTFEGHTVTRLELEQRTNRLARAYQRLGVVQDDFVTIALPNGIGFYESAIAAWKLGATPQPISARLPRLEVEAIVEVANPRIVVGGEPGSLADRTVVPEGFVPDSSLSHEPLPERVARHWKAPTSGGSTGRPKLIVAEQPGEFDPEDEEGRVQLTRMARDRAHLVPGPLYHNGPFSMSMAALFLGNHIVVLPRFDALRTLECIERYQIDWVFLVPTMMQRIWRLESKVRDRFDLSSLRVMLHNAAPCPAWLKEAWIDWLGPDRIHELYGGTEGMALTWITGPEWLQHRGSVGKCVAGKIRVLDENGRDLEPGQIGEIYMMPDEGPGTTYHYVGAAPKSLDGWESLGDMGRVDEEGYVYLADRQTDMILRGGSNVYPAEVEAAIDAHPRVRSSAVIGLPHEDLGQRVHAIVDAPEAVTEKELLAHLAERLVRYKIPESFEFVSEPLRADDGKVRRSALRDERIQAMGPEASESIPTG